MQKNYNTKLILNALSLNYFQGENMINRYSLLSVFLLLLVSFTLISNNVNAQVVTTSSMNGTVTDSNGDPLPGANIIAVHQSSGSQYGTSTRLDGKYNINGMRVGGPYTITVSFVGYNNQAIEGVYLELGQNLRLNISLTEEAVQLGDITVVAERSGIISSDRTGTSTMISEQTIETLPTITRRMEDLTRLTPQFGRNSSFGGIDNRLNNITIDGSYFNNSFGLSRITW